MSLFFTKAESFEEAVAPFEKQIYFTCLGMMGNSQDAQDCAQELGCIPLLPAAA